jgi:hypothetical protein
MVQLFDEGRWEEFNAELDESFKSIKKQKVGLQDSLIGVMFDKLISLSLLKA